jgi:hypothetical protein
VADARASINSLESTQTEFGGLTPRSKQLARNALIINRTLTERERAHIADLYDQNPSLTTRAELLNFLYSIGQYILDKDLDDLIGDTNWTEGAIMLLPALMYVLAMLKIRHQASRVDDVTAAFRALSNEGESIAAADFRRIVEAFHLTVDVDRMLAEADEDGSGLIEQDEFEEMINKIGKASKHKHHSTESGPRVTHFSTAIVGDTATDDGDSSVDVDFESDFLTASHSSMRTIQSQRTSLQQTRILVDPQHLPPKRSKSTTPQVLSRNYSNGLLDVGFALETVESVASPQDHTLSVQDSTFTDGFRSPNFLDVRLDRRGEGPKHLRRSIAPLGQGSNLSKLLKRSKTNEIQYMDSHGKRQVLSLPPLKPKPALTGPYDRKAPKWTVNYASFMYK